ncbi:unnamed protein product [Gongylonema pulchrum]|uniref:RNA polymerase II subunit A C-terminal domain phosphatase SSU72 n=1 Tax=Gongylonema pulchrum TaxID=637853 RepID=A0A183E3G7_9BILA|nr:unnamed protein product [Gongylonema pulchrum]
MKRVKMVALKNAATNAAAIQVKMFYFFPKTVFGFRKRGFNVESFGSGSQVKLPGPSPDRPNCYEFGMVSYEYIYNDLKQKDFQLYTQNGLLHMLDRNRRIKDMPQKFQHFKGKFDVIICLEERVYDQVWLINF